MWLLMILISTIILIIPGSLKQMANLLGFELESNMVLCIFIVVLLLISIALTVMITKLKKEVTLLIQEVGIIKKEMESNKWNIFLR